MSTLAAYEFRSVFLESASSFSFYIFSFSEAASFKNLIFSSSVVAEAAFLVAVSMSAKVYIVFDFCAAISSLF